jgi:hypothetical protein
VANLSIASCEDAKPRDIRVLGTHVGARVVPRGVREERQISQSRAAF